MAPSSSQRILVVDDEVNVRITLAANLELAGFEVVEAGSVAEAQSHLERGRFDMLVSDVRMPEIDGVSGLEKLRAVQPDLPAVLVTGYDAEGTLGHALAKGAYTVLAKPISIERLLDVIRRGMKHPIVLVVDDEPTFLEGVVEGLRAAGLKVERAHDGASALEVVRGRSVDVCVLDLVLPDRDGAQVCADLRAESPETAIIAMTSYDVGDLVRELMKGGAYECLKKPLEIDALARSIGRARAQSAGRGP